MYRQISTFLISFFLFTTCYAQLDSFHLRDFVLPEVDIKQLDINANIKGSNNIENRSSSPKTSNFQTKMDLQYNHFYNSPKVQLQSSGSLHLAYQISNSSQSSPSLEQSTFNGSNNIYICHASFLF